MFLKLIKKSLTNNFVKNFSLLLAGSSAGQVVTLLSAPILTRLYEPSDFAIYAIFTGFLNALSPGICGRYELAIAIAPRSAESKALKSVAILAAAGLSSLVFIIFIFLGSQINSSLNLQTFGNWIYVVPFALFLIGIRETMKSYANSQKNYKEISYVAFLQSFSLAFAACFFGLMGYNEVGLVLSILIASVMSTILFCWFYRTESNFLKFKASISQWEYAVKYRQFPFFNAPASVLNGLTLALPIFFLARDYPEAIVGYYALVMRAIMGPLSLISGSVSVVHLRAIADIIQTSSPVFGYMAKLTCFLLLVSGIPGAIIFITGPDLFALVFGEAWRPAGAIVSILIPAMVVKFVVSTLSPVFSSTGNSHLAAGWRVLGFIVTILLFLNFSGVVGIFELVYFIMIADIALYALYFALICLAVSRPKSFI